MSYGVVCGSHYALSIKCGKLPPLMGFGNSLILWEWCALKYLENSGNFVVEKKKTAVYQNSMRISLALFGLFIANLLTII